MMDQKKIDNGQKALEWWSRIQKIRNDNHENNNDQLWKNKKPKNFKEPFVGKSKDFLYSVKSIKFYTETLFILFVEHYSGYQPQCNVSDCPKRYCFPKTYENYFTRNTIKPDFVWKKYARHIVTEIFAMNKPVDLKHLLLLTKNKMALRNILLHKKHFKKIIPFIYTQIPYVRDLHEIPQEDCNRLFNLPNWRKTVFKNKNTKLFLTILDNL